MENSSIDKFCLMMKEVQYSNKDGSTSNHLPLSTNTPEVIQVLQNSMDKLIIAIAKNEENDIKDKSIDLTNYLVAFLVNKKIINVDQHQD